MKNFLSNNKNSESEKKNIGTLANNNNEVIILNKYELNLLRGGEGENEDTDFDLG